MTETSPAERRTNENWFGTQEKSSNQCARFLRRKLMERRAEKERTVEGRKDEFSGQKMKRGDRVSSRRLEATSKPSREFLSNSYDYFTRKYSTPIKIIFNIGRGSNSYNANSRLITTGGRVNDLWQSNRTGIYVYVLQSAFIVI